MISLLWPVAPAVAGEAAPVPGFAPGVRMEGLVGTEPRPS
jgi:hypothetical protein